VTLDAEAFIRARTRLAPVPLVPEISLFGAQALEPLWKELEALSGDPDCPPPFWAFPWAGGVGLARFVLDHPEHVRGKRVLDFASGSGLVGIAAALAGAKQVAACDIDPLAQAAGQLNAEANGVSVTVVGAVDFKRVPKGVDVILAGDVCYDHLMAHRSLAWLRLCAAAGVMVLLGDPARAYAPQDGVELLASVTVPTVLEIEDREEREVSIWHFVASI